MKTYPRTYPRYFVGRWWSERDAYLRFDSQHSCVWVRNDGTESPQPCGSSWNADRPDDTWYEVTPEMARARLLPVAQPLRWVENCKPDKPGIWAMLWNGEISVNDLNEDEVESRYLVLGTRCYLGPIPEILPPKKKVVERLWIRRNMGQDYYDYLWVAEPTEPGGYIRTDETREVEQ